MKDQSTKRNTEINFQGFPNIMEPEQKSTKSDEDSKNSSQFSR